MVKVAIYTMLRIIGLSHAHVTAIAYIAIAFGIVSSVWGILYAVVMRDLKHLLAYSTVENIGLIILSFGTMLLANRFGLEMAAQLSLAAAIYHIINHSLNKSMSFCVPAPSMLLLTLATSRFLVDCIKTCRSLRSFSFSARCAYVRFLRSTVSSASGIYQSVFQYELGAHLHIARQLW